MTRPIELWYWPTPNGWKISVALEEMEIPYELKPVNIGAGEQFRPEFLAISPNNRMPAIVDPEGPDGRSAPRFAAGAASCGRLQRRTPRRNPSPGRSRSPQAYVGGRRQYTRGSKTG